MSRKRITATLFVLVCVAAVVAVAALWPWLTRNPVGPPKAELPQSVEGGDDLDFGRLFVGHTEADIVAKYGPASDRWTDHYGPPDLGTRWAYPDAISAAYDQPSGTLYLTYCQERGRLVCCWSHWMPTGLVF